MLDRLLAISAETWIVMGIGVTISMLLFGGAGNIAPPLFDPLGSAAVPLATAWALLGCTLGIGIQAFIATGGGDDPPAREPLRPATFAVAVLMALYLLAMAAGLGFVMATIAFTALAVPIVSATWRSFPVAIALALVLGFGADWIFTSVFFIDLPSAR